MKRPPGRFEIADSGRGDPGTRASIVVTPVPPGGDPLYVANRNVAMISVVDGVSSEVRAELTFRAGSGARSPDSTLVDPQAIGETWIDDSSDSEESVALG